MEQETTTHPKGHVHVPSFSKTTCEVLAGVSAGISGTIFGHPLDTIKVRLQTETRYKGTYDCFKILMREDGVGALFRGIAAPITGLTILNAFSFAVYGRLKESLKARWQKTGYSHDSLSRSLGTELPIFTYYAAGIGTGILSAFGATPFEVIKISMQVSSKKAKAGIADDTIYKGSLDCVKKIVRTKGVMALYNGFWPSFIRELAFCGTYFSVYEVFKHLLGQTSDKKTINPFAVAVAGGCAGCAGWICALPPDQIKSIVQSRYAGSIAPETLRYMNMPMPLIAKDIWQREGLAGFFKGIKPTVARSFVVSSVRFLTFEYAFKAFSNLNEL